MFSEHATGVSCTTPSAPVTAPEHLTVCGAAKSSAKKGPALSWEGNGSRCPWYGAIMSKQMLKYEWRNKKSIIVDAEFNRFPWRG